MVLSTGNKRYYLYYTVGILFLGADVIAAYSAKSTHFTTSSCAISNSRRPSRETSGRVGLLKEDGIQSYSRPTDSRRRFLSTVSSQIGLLSLSSLTRPALAAENAVQVTEEELDAIYREEQQDNDNRPPPDIPQAPEERSGLVVLRVAEVAQFQEKILRSIVSGDLEGVMVAPLQFTFGTKILLKNSNLDGNMKLMIAEEIPRSARKMAARNASVTMNTLQDIIVYSNSIQRDFEPEEMLHLADMYRTIRINLNQLYEYLPEREKDKYYGYFVAVTEYEKKIADGVYNPDIDGVLKFD